MRSPTLAIIDLIDYHKVYGNERDDDMPPVAFVRRHVWAARHGVSSKLRFLNPDTDIQTIQTFDFCIRSMKSILLFETTAMKQWSVRSRHDFCQA